MKSKVIILLVFLSFSFTEIHEKTTEKYLSPPNWIQGIWYDDDNSRNTMRFTYDNVIINTTRGSSNVNEVMDDLNKNKIKGFMEPYINEVSRRDYYEFSYGINLKYVTFKISKLGNSSFEIELSDGTKTYTRK